MCGAFYICDMDHPIINGLNIPARTIFCIGRNYAKHAAEMNADIPSTPVVFLKPLSSICYSGDTVKLPIQSKSVHYEGEIVVAIGKSGNNINEEDALKHIAGIGCGIDFTARDLQKDAKVKGLPWSISKGFKNFAPISNFLPLSGLSLQDLGIELTLNDEIRQSGKVSDMIFSIPALVSYLSTITTLYPGDLIFTGTPEGVGQVKEDEIVTAAIPTLNCSVSVRIT